MNEGCKGCADETSTSSKECYIRNSGTQDDVQNCPCKECLIKPMCHEACEDYEKLSDIVGIHYNER